jgi:hypothetical protein
VTIHEPAWRRCGSWHSPPPVFSAGRWSSAVRLTNGEADGEEDDEADRVRYVVIGGVAALVHNLPVPATVDIDVTPSRDLNNLERLAAAFDTLEAGLLTAEEPGTWFPRHPGRRQAHEEAANRPREAAYRPATSRNDAYAFRQVNCHFSARTLVTETPRSRRGVLVDRQHAASHLSLPRLSGDRGSIVEGLVPQGPAASPEQGGALRRPGQSGVGTGRTRLPGQRVARASAFDRQRRGMGWFP